jgi:hypothetical protein
LVWIRRIRDGFLPHEIRAWRKGAHERQKGRGDARAACFLLNNLLDTSPLLVCPRHVRIFLRHVGAPVRLDHSLACSAERQVKSISRPGARTALGVEREERCTSSMIEPPRQHREDTYRFTKPWQKVNGIAANSASQIQSLSLPCASFWAARASGRRRLNEMPFHVPSKEDYNCCTGRWVRCGHGLVTSRSPDGRAAASLPEASENELQ